MFRPDMIYADDLATDLALIIKIQKYPLDVPLVEFVYLVFTRMPGQSCRRSLRPWLLCLCDVFQPLMNSLAMD